MADKIITGVSQARLPEVVRELDFAGGSSITTGINSERAEEVGSDKIEGDFIEN